MGLGLRQQCGVVAARDGLLQHQDQHGVEKTVKNYVSHLLAKLGMSSRTQAAVLSTEIRGRNHAQN